MAATRLPDGSVVMRPSGQRPYPTGGGTGVTRPAVARGGGPGAGGTPMVVNGSTRQRGRAATSTDAYR